MTKPWEATQQEVWGDKDPEVFRRVVERIQRVEPKMLAEIDEAIAACAPTHAIAWIAVNYVLRGIGAQGKDCAPDGMRWDAFSNKWVQDGAKSGPAITTVPVGA